MSLVPVDIPPGMYRNGTPLQAKPRWREGNFVRWVEGALQPQGGWIKRQKDDTDLVVPTVPRSSFMWRANSGAAWYVVGSTSALTAFSNAVDIDPITPADLVAGVVDATTMDGYGVWDYGEGDYGVPALVEASQATLAPCTVWALDNFGENLIAMSTADRRILMWAPGAPANAAPITAVGATPTPTTNNWVLVTNERMIMALGADGNPRKVAWSDQEDPTDWTSTPLNFAGDIELQTNGQLITGRKTPDGVLIWTSEDIHLARFIGLPFVYSFQAIAGKTSIASAQAAAVIDSRVVWMGHASFWVYDGHLTPLPSDVADEVYRNINRYQISKTWSMVNHGMQEVVWFYPSAGSNEVDSYVTWNYRDNYWLNGRIIRTTGWPAGILPNPILVDVGGQLWNHNQGYEYEGQHPFIESWPIELGEGETQMLVKQLVPDELQLGDVEVSFRTRLYPTAPEIVYGPYSLKNPTNLRLSARQVAIRFTGVRPVSWRIGRMKLNVQPRGGRPFGG